MSLFSSFIIDPVVRQARRFSSAANNGPAPATAGDGFHMLNADSAATTTTTTTPAPPDESAFTSDEETPGRSRPVPLDEGSPQHGSASARRPPPAVDGEQQRASNDGTVHPPLGLPRRITAPSAPMDIPGDGDMSANPSHTLDVQFRRLNLDPAHAVTHARDIARPASTTAATAHHAPPTMSESLPADDGMRHLRARIHDIRALRIDDADKARMMHGLMTERYNYMRPTSPSSFVSHDRPFTPTSNHSVFSDVRYSSPVSTTSEADPENPFNLRPGDAAPTYRPRPSNLDPNTAIEEDDGDLFEDEPPLGCEHYKRNVKVQCYECRRWYTCRHCHDAVEDHNLERKKTQNMLCMACGTPQKAAEYCTQCGTQAACYYCDICKLWDNNSSKKIYHCDDCGICRRGEGLGKDYVHCKNCNVCISIAFATTHKCIERATDSDCPICGEYLFYSTTAVVSMPCGHYLHKECYNQYMETAYKCPTCKKSAVNMELQWQKLTLAIDSQPMPEQFLHTRAIIQCNDCSAKSSVAYHWLGNKCSSCDSYNTSELRLLNGPESEQTANAILSAEAADSPSPFLSPSPRPHSRPLSIPSPSSLPLRSPRYYFQPDEPVQTWLPGPLPSFPFQMPQFPRGMPQLPAGLGGRIPRMPEMPALPQMPDAYELLDRVRRSFDHYLNPTGEVALEAVPFVDLGEGEDASRGAPTGGATGGAGENEGGKENEREREMLTQVRALPQYVLERFSRSVVPLRRYLSTEVEGIPKLDLGAGEGEDDEEEDREGRLFWGEDGGRWERWIGGEGGREDDDEEEGSSSESEGEEGDGEEEGEEEEEEEDDNEFELPGHR